MFRAMICIPAVSLALLALAPRSASAGFILRLTSGNTTVTVIDNIQNDLDNTLGEIAYGGPGTIGTFTIDPTTGAASKPILGGPNEATFDLHLDVFSLEPGTLRVEMTDTGFSLTDSNNPWTLHSSIGGLTDGSILYAESLDTNNSEFATNNLGNDTTNTFPTLTGDPSFSANLATAVITQGNPFSLTEFFTITHGEGAQFTTFDADSLVTVIPEPASCLLWATGATVLGFWRYRRRKGS